MLVLFQKNIGKKKIANASNLFGIINLAGKLGNGGLKMIDIQSYFMSLKASWVSRLVS